MNDELTVLVLGAGASRPYGFPLGPSLVDQIRSSFPHALWDGADKSQSDTIRVTYAEPGAAFCTKLHDSALYSVDLFLEKNRDWRQLGKLAIATALLPCENARRLENRAGDGANEDHWYRWLTNWLMRGTGLGNFPRHNVAIITYNYDRSLEYFMHRAVMSAYGISSMQARDLVRKVPIVHVHGSLGPLPWDADGAASIEYGAPHRLCAAALAASQSISIVYEDEIESSSGLARAREILMSAHWVVFLGFGFDETNVSRLEIARQCPHHPGVLGTCFGLTPTEQTAARHLLIRHCGHDNIRLEDRKCLDFLRNSCFV